MIKYIVSKVQTSTDHEKLGNILKLEDFLYEQEWTLEDYGMFDTPEEAEKCLQEHNYFWHRCYRFYRWYECHIEYVKIEEVEWDEKENEIVDYKGIWDSSFENFEVKD